MDTQIFYTPDIYTTMLNHLSKVPFAKMDDGYRFAYWVHDLNVRDEDLQNLAEAPHGDEAKQFLDAAKAELMEIVVSEDDYLAWTAHKKEVGGVTTYHKVMHDLAINLMLLTVNITADDIEQASHNTEETEYQFYLNNHKSKDSRRILNHKNPFADVTIKNQQFFYKSSSSEAETLFFSASNVVEKTEKNEKNMFSMRPGFSVVREKGVVQQPIQTVTFSNSMVESIVGDEDHIYIHID